MRGKIIKGIGGFYYVHVQEDGVYACRARGIFRLEKKKPLVGDDVQISVTDEKDREGSVDQLLPRKNELIRPAAANVDQALVVFAMAKPAPNMNLLDRFLISMRTQGIPTAICFNKTDLGEESQIESLKKAYAGSGCQVFFVCVKKNQGLEGIREFLDGKTTIVAGPSGVGKSSLTNILQPEAMMETGEISRKAERGKHTTRHTQLIWLWKDTYLMDTPGFSSLFLPEISDAQLPLQYPEFAEYEPQCRFQGCMHRTEPDCAVRKAVEDGKISALRYENYGLLLQELKERKRF